MNEIIKYFKDPSIESQRITIKALDNEWYLIYGNIAAHHEFNDEGSESNFKIAYERMLSSFPEAREI